MGTRNYIPVHTATEESQNNLYLLMENIEFCISDLEKYIEVYTYSRQIHIRHTPFYTVLYLL
jgi:hypothetical protein